MHERAPRPEDRVHTGAWLPFSDAFVTVVHMQLLKRKAEERNPDEFYFAMVSTFLSQGWVCLAG